jgi:hypothetical protein
MSAGCNEGSSADFPWFDVKFYVPRAIYVELDERNANFGTYMRGKVS